MRKGFLILFLFSLMILLAACNSEQSRNEKTAPTVQAATTATTAVKETVQSTIAATQKVSSIPETQNTAAEPTPTEAEQEQPQNNYDQPEYEEEQPQEVQSGDLQMTIGGTPVSVAWEDNDAVQSLKELCRN
ncbi:MAG: hypothetical protein IJX77_06875, partial [Ruminococcus sp.]|nr:hypothetical protein [Ruminococcus sp.]